MSKPDKNKEAARIYPHLNSVLEANLKQEKAAQFVESNPKRNGQHPVWLITTPHTVFKQ